MGLLHSNIYVFIPDPNTDLLHVIAV